MRNASEALQAFLYLSRPAGVGPPQGLSRDARLRGQRAGEAINVENEQDLAIQFAHMIYDLTNAWFQRFRRLLIKRGVDVNYCPHSIYE